MNIEHFVGVYREDNKIAGSITHSFDIYIGNRIFSLDIEFGFNKNGLFLPVAIKYNRVLKEVTLHFLCFYIAFPVIRKYIWYPDDEE
jgi:hypothetical protein